MTDTIEKGGCACGKVRFEARGDPYRVGVCHCLTCRKVRGAPFNFYVVFPRDAVTVKGDVTVFASSEHGRRYSCRACGAPVYSHYDRPDEIDLYLGSFDEPGLGSRVMSYGGGGASPGCPSSLPSFAATREIARSGSEPSADPIVSQLTLAGLRLMVRP
jgi:hypothetical protein